MPKFQPPTRKSLPILEVKGSYYEVGYEIGRTFGDRIRRLVQSTSKQLESSAGYDPEFADNVFANAAKIVQHNFPQFWEEMWGTADGARLEFRQLFTLYLADIVEFDSSKRARLDKVKELEGINEAEEGGSCSSAASGKRGVNESPSVDAGSEPGHQHIRGCSDILVNVDGLVAIGHTEDLSPELVDECYVTRVHYADVPGRGLGHGGQLQLTGEEFVTGYLYPGDLPGYAMAASAHFAFSVNDVSSAEVDPWGTPKGILARAALACKTLDEIVWVLTDVGHGIASGISINVLSLDDNPRRLYNIEVACHRDRDDDDDDDGIDDGSNRPSSADPSAATGTSSTADTSPRRSRVSVHEVLDGEVYFHCNVYRRLGVAPNPFRGTSSQRRMAVMNGYPRPATIDDLKKILSDDSDEDYPIFRGSKSRKDYAATSAISIFDGRSDNWKIYTDKATNADTLCISLPLRGGIRN